MTSKYSTLNHDTLDLSDYTTKPVYITHAWCDRCQRYEFKRQLDDCPRCHALLFWQQKTLGQFQQRAEKRIRGLMSDTTLSKPQVMDKLNLTQYSRGVRGVGVRMDVLKKQTEFTE